MADMADGQVHHQGLAQGQVCRKKWIGYSRLHGTKLNLKRLNINSRVQWKIHD